LESGTIRAVAGYKSQCLRQADLQRQRALLPIGGCEADRARAGSALCAQGSMRKAGSRMHIARQLVEADIKPSECKLTGSLHAYDYCLRGLAEGGLAALCRAIETRAWVRCSLWFQSTDFGVTDSRTHRDGATTYRAESAASPRAKLPNPPADRAGLGQGRS